MKTAKQLFDEAFRPGRTPRSPEYRAGLMNQLRYRMRETGRHTCPHKEGTASADAYWSGVDEAWKILTREKCDFRAIKN